MNEETVAVKDVKSMRSPNDAAIEKEIVAKGLTAPRVTPDDLEDKVARVEYQVFADSTLTVCVITMVNGFTVTGESACASPENFNKELGEKIAYQKAKDKMWPLLGYALKERLSPNMYGSPV